MMHYSDGVLAWLGLGNEDEWTTDLLRKEDAETSFKPKPPLRRRSDWSGGRVAEGGALLRHYTARYRGFESPPLRQLLFRDGSPSPPAVRFFAGVSDC